MKIRFDYVKLSFFSVGIILICAGCSLIGLPFTVAEDTLDTTGVIVEEVGEAL